MSVDEQEELDRYAERAAAAYCENIRLRAEIKRLQRELAELQAKRGKQDERKHLSSPAD